VPEGVLGRVLPKRCHVSPSLPHQPNRRAGGDLTTGSSQEEVVVRVGRAEECRC